MARSKSSAKLSVFKGREAKLNRAIFQTLALRGPQTIYDIHKQVKTHRGLRYAHYVSVSKRVKILLASSFIKTAGAKKTKAGFEAVIYELTARAYLAMVLNINSLEELLIRLDEPTANAILAEIIQAIPSQA